MQCSNETLVRLFYNVTFSFQLLFLLFFLTSILLSKIFTFIFGNPFSERNEDDYEYGTFSEEEEEETNAYYHQESMEKDHLVADIIHGGEKLSFLHNKRAQMAQNLVQETANPEDHDAIIEDATFDSDQLSVYSSPASEFESANYEFDYDQVIVEDLGETDRESDDNFDTNDNSIMDLGRNEKLDTREAENVQVENMKVTREENFFTFAPQKLETKRIEVQEKNEEEIFGDTCTVGSTSKNSSDWRSSINCRDSGTEDPFSSSSRRSCPKWESYTVFQKYDEEMLFLDRISAQKLHETESLRSIQACPRSISERIVHKLSTRNKQSSNSRRQNPYQELEGAYVAQICLTWEALNWNHKYFQRLRASRHGSDPGCPAYIAQQFQQFQVLLQRYVENEPYEHGRRPEIYARMRSIAPKLLQVPEYRDSDDDKRVDYLGSRISSLAFLRIMEESIGTFMNFLKADKESHCQILKSFFRRNSRRGSVDPTLILLQKKVNKKKTTKVKDLRRGHNCIRKRKLKVEDEMEILMALIDLKIVSRVLRMTDLSEEQLHWCEDKMTKVRVGDGKLQRDSSPLFFPAH